MKIAVVGMGKMGQWIAAHLAGEHTVAGYDIDDSRIFPDGVDRLTGIEQIGDFSPEMCINAVELDGTIGVFTSLFPYLDRSCMLADIAAVKNPLAPFYRESGRPFVSTHPMFGPNDEKLTKQNAVIITESDPKGKDFFRGFYTGLGLSIYEYDFEEHDREIAYSLSVPFVSSIVFAGCVEEKNPPGSNFRRHMKIARGLLSEDIHLISEILFNPATLKQVERINQRLSYLTHIIRDEDREELIKFLLNLKENIHDEH
ncbi:MAG: prephenate dehydrogenase/arogenate dehydrogenase family protein [Spirochaetota bacterium]